MRIYKIAAAVLMVQLTTGCSGTLDNMIWNADQSLPRPQASVLHGIDHGKARYCLDRAKEDVIAAKVGTAFDVGLVALGSAATGAGTTFGAISAATDNKQAKQDWGTASATLVASGAAVLLLRTALNLSEAARRQRVAAARRIQAAAQIAERPRRSSTENETRTQDDPFSDCIAADKDAAEAVAQLGTGGGSRPPPASSVEQRVMDATDTLKELHETIQHLEQRKVSIERGLKDASSEDQARLQSDLDSVNEKLTKYRGDLQMANEALDAARTKLQNE